MSDARLSELERASKEGDPIARYRFRVECVRIGKPELAGFEVGDKVRVVCEGLKFVGWVKPYRGRIHVSDGKGYTCEPRVHEEHGIAPGEWTLLEPARPA